MSKKNSNKTSRVVKAPDVFIKQVNNTTPPKIQEKDDDPIEVF